MNQLITRGNTPNKTTSQLDYLLIDGSGSMIDKWWDTLDAIEQYIQGIKALEVRSHILAQVFDDHDLDYLARDTTTQDWIPLRQEPIGAHWGFSPLYDAVNVMGRRLRDLDPPRCSVVIVTDGDENHSKTNLAQAKAILEWCRAKGYQITFIGAEFDNSNQAKLLGATSGSTIGVSKANLKLATGALASKRKRYEVSGDPMHYTDEEQQKFGGYLGHG